MFQRDRLDKGYFVLHALQLAQRLVIVKQADVHGGEVPVFQDFLELFAFQCGRAHNGNAEEVLGISFHRDSGASS